MKKTIFTFLGMLMLVFFVSTTFAQVPQGFNYQAVARNSVGNLLQNQAVGVKLSIHQGSAVGTVVYSERQTPSTNQFGLFTATVGQGTVLSGAFATINWSTGSYWLQAELDAAGGTAYTDMGTSQLLSVPYAMYAANAGSAAVSGTLNYVPKFTSATTIGNSNIFDNGTNVGIHQPNPLAALHIKGIDNSFDGGIRLEDDATTEYGNILYGLEGMIYHSKTAGNDHLFLTSIKNAVSTPALIIKDDGNVGIGTAAPTNILEVVNGTTTATKFRVGTYASGYHGFGQDFSSTSPSYFFGHGGAYWHFMYAATPADTYTALVTLDGAGNVFRSTSNNVVSLGNASYKWTAVYATNGTIQTSDKRYKNDITNINYGLAEVLKLRPVSYTWKDKSLNVGTGINLGFIAQELQSIVPDVVVHSNTEVNKETGKVDSEYSDVYSVKYSELIPVLVKAIQEQQAEIETLKLQIKDLQK